MVTAANVQIDRNNGRDTARHGITLGENAAVEGAVADRHHPLRIGRRGVRSGQRFLHVAGNRAGHEQDVGVSG